MFPLWQLLDPVLGAVQVFQNMHSLPRQIAQLPNRPLRRPAAWQLAAFQQVGNPLRILGIGLLTVESLDRLRIHQHPFVELALQ